MMLRYFIILSFLLCSAALSFDEKGKRISEEEYNKVQKKEDQPTDEELAKRKIERIDKTLNSIGMKGIKQTLEEERDKEERLKKGRGCLKFININSKKKSLLRNLGLAREELYKARFRNNCDFGVEFTFTILFYDKDGYVFEKHNSNTHVLFKNSVEEVTENVAFFPSTDFKKIRQVDIKIRDEALHRPRAPKEFTQ